MQNTAINIILLLMVLTFISAAALYWWEPTGARKLALLLNRRAEALSASRREYQRVWKSSAPKTQEVV